MHNCQSTGSPQTLDLALFFFSYCSMKYKINSIKTLISRAYKICSSYPLLHIEFNLLKVFFKNNGFNTELLDRCISKYLSKLYERNNVNSPEQNRSFYISFPYFGPYSDKLSNELSNLFRKYFSNIDSKIIMTNPFKISSLFFLLR